MIVVIYIDLALVRCALVLGRVSEQQTKMFIYHIENEEDPKKNNRQNTKKPFDKTKSAISVDTQK